MLNKLIGRSGKIIFVFFFFHVALNPREPIGSQEGRNFVLCKKQLQPQMTEMRSDIVAKKPSGWKALMTAFLPIWGLVGT